MRRVQASAEASRATTGESQHAVGPPIGQPHGSRSAARSCSQSGELHEYRC